MPRVPVRSRVIPAIALAIASMAFAPHAAFAQQPAGGFAANQADGPQTLSLNFAGGTALEYIDALRKAMPNANIVVLGELARVNMLPVQLNAVDLESALRLLDQLPQAQGDLAVKVRVENVRTSQDVPDVFAVSAEVRGRGQGEGPMQTAVISMADVLGENLKPADALTAIQTALELLGSESEPARIKFHEETGLLIARGNPHQMECIGQVMSQLRERAGTIEARQRQAEQQVRSAASEQLMGEVTAKAKEQNAALMQQATFWQTKADQVSKSLELLQAQVANLQDELRAAVADREQLKRQLAEVTRAKEPKP